MCLYIKYIDINLKHKVNFYIAAAINAELNTYLKTLNKPNT